MAAKKKSELVEGALGELGLQRWAFDIPPELMEDGVRRMDSMVASWMETGLQLSYDFLAESNQLSGLSLQDELAVELNLAISLAPMLGKIPSQETKNAAATALEALNIRAAAPVERQMPASMPRGAGAKSWRSVTSPFLRPPDYGVLQVGDGGQIEIKRD